MIDSYSAFNSFSPVVGFAIAAFLLNLSPGPSIIFATSRGISDGKAAGIFSALGLATGSACHAILAGIGVTGLLAKSYYGTLAVGILGGGYLLFLGWRALASNDGFSFSADSAVKSRQSLQALYGQAVMVEFFNPKTAIFYLSLVPSFIISQHYSVFEAVLFALIVPATALPIDICAGISGGLLAKFFSDSKNAAYLLNKITAVVLILLGIWAIWNTVK